MWYIIIYYYYCLTFLGLQWSSPQGWKDTISPVISCHVESSKHLRCSDSFRVHSHLSVRSTTVCHWLHEYLYTTGLTSPTRPQCHHSMTDSLCLIQLYIKKFLFDLILYVPVNNLSVRAATPVRLKPVTLWSPVKYSTTEPLHSPHKKVTFSLKNNIFL